jgi:hypothetical protein
MPVHPAGYLGATVVVTCEMKVAGDRVVVRGDETVPARSG